MFCHKNFIHFAIFVLILILVVYFIKTLISLFQYHKIDIKHVKKVDLSHKNATLENILFFC
ncbi:MAG: hypothetical protein COT46_04775 [Sulfurimonas sp. CG08_land_8_20_14_0_20_36_33]|nr:MAG: hypothetical protein AUJ81_07225 [Helicobacteraceae bacterium CG1_02_36_14]PIP10973.1 MAG: hypothetical protein COX50_02935 [Sulfurimonas sp. CG23_combo_of_CG06-09_8_20_14_all_36_33]PIS25781.1 MAG: hypothetical protein COT46_04775 [Sulfurimonas sp. CG08_land_8_20_14_0_20_36_33]PIU34381.1 MAG: hypothetical protein COT05_07720 [Sulfurimonas sp. CG07_land_8_20_14_0_80_36_56]PIV02723.1 MAG: hypothetical protein COS56_10830 [Sulfurimonas sp. CG03_land_8_20_14_0_80_36_25]PIV34569.1 MAG: hypo